MGGKRLDWIDGLRAVAILFVMTGHFLEGAHSAPFDVFTSPIKIPLFFAVSGFLFAPERYQSAGQFLAQIARRLLVPYLFLAVLSNMYPLLRAAADGTLPEEAARLLTGIATGRELWFLPCLIVVNVYAYIVFLLARGRWHAGIAAAALIGVAGFWVARPGRELPWRVDTAMIMLPFFCEGMLFKRHMGFIERILGRWWHALCLIGAYLGVCLLGVALYGFRSLDVNLNRYFDYVLCPLACLVGVAAMFLLFRRLRMPGFLVYVGQNTLTYYALHAIAHGAILWAFARAGLTFFTTEHWAAVAVALILTSAALVVPAELFNRFVPFLVGRKRNPELSFYRVALRGRSGG